MNQMWFILISSASLLVHQPRRRRRCFHFSRQFVHSHDSHVCHICLQLTSFYNNNFSCCICCSKLFALIMHCSSSFPPRPHTSFLIYQNNEEMEYFRVLDRLSKCQLMNFSCFPFKKILSKVHLISGCRL